jgi:hypothetical protein
MAGAGYKLFNTGDVLTAAQVNTYLMEQTVMVFANAAARTTALSGVVSEGMISYLKDTNAVEVYDGSNWVSSDDPNAIQNTIVDAKGDLITATAADTPARLAVGSNGDTLVANSAESTGLIWAKPVASLSNPVINGGFDIWQRGTSFSSPNAVYVADRWKAEGSTPACTISRQATGDTTNLPNIQYGLRFQRNSGQTNTTAVYLYTGIETANALPFAGKAITVSFYAKRGADYSSSSNILSYFLNSGTGTDESPSGSYTGNVSVASGNVTLTTSYQRFVFTGTIGATATEFKIGFNYTPSGTAGANDWFEVTGVQVDFGTWTASTAPTFRRSGGTIQGELAACQRYYWRSADNSAYAGHAMGIARETTAISTQVVFPVPMRTAPTSFDVSNLQYSDGVGTITVSAPGLAQKSNRMAVLDEAVTGATQYRPYFLRNANNTAGYIGFSAEL